MNYEKLQEELEEYLQRKLEETRSNGYVIGVSGGIDSAVTLKVAVEAVGSEKVNAWIMPGEPTKKQNLEDARELCEELGVETREVDVEPATREIQGSLDFDIGEETVGNIRARIRMIYEYIDANEKNLLVLGSGNRTEYLLGYFTKFGDGAADLRLLEDLYKTEVKELAEHLDLDKKFIEKKPTAGLWKDQTDEDELGASYETIDTILEHLHDQGLNVEETREKTGIQEEKIRKFQRMHQNSRHKREPAEAPKLR